MICRLAMTKTNCSFPNSMRPVQSSFTMRDWTCILLYNGLLIIGSPLWLCALLWLTLQRPKIRPGLWQKLGFQSLPLLPSVLDGQPRLWIHCVSVGELNAAAPLIDALGHDYVVSVSVTTVTAYGLAQQRHDHVFYCPFDLPWAVWRTLTHVKPHAVLVMETEIWPNLYAFARLRCPLGLWVINGRLSPRSFRGYVRLGAFMRWVLSLPRCVLTQSVDDATTFRALGAQDVRPMGNLKFDLTTYPDLLAIQGWQARLPARHVVLFASTHEAEEALLMPVVQWLLAQPDTSVVLAPRHPERRHEVLQLLQRYALDWVLQTDTPTRTVYPGQVLVLDTVGQLPALYGAVDLAVMGGSFVPKGGQNPLEPLSQGVPVLTGPAVFNFKAIIAMLSQADALTLVPDVSALQVTLTLWYKDPAPFQGMAQRGQQCIQAGRGATQVVLDALANANTIFSN
jgi:3-deoxy-D-manno-octulosonic-acid transferase